MTSTGPGLKSEIDGSAAFYGAAKAGPYHLLKCPHTPPQRLTARKDWQGLNRLAMPNDFRSALFEVPRNESSFCGSRTLTMRPRSTAISGNRIHTFCPVHRGISLGIPMNTPRSYNQRTLDNPLSLILEPPSPNADTCKISVVTNYSSGIFTVLGGAGSPRP